MKITNITQQQKRTDRYSIFIEGKYSFSLSEGALLESGLYRGQELTSEQIAEYKQFSAEDKLYNRALRYVAMRPRSIWEMHTYLERKGASPSLTEQIVSKLTKLDLLNDEKFAQAFVADRRLLRPTSRRKLVDELRKRRIADDFIEEAVGYEAVNERTALADIVARKRKQTMYQDDLKLMQYLARQGFKYDDIKSALQQAD